MKTPFGIAAIEAVVPGASARAASRESPDVNGYGPASVDPTVTISLSARVAIPTVGLQGYAYMP
jgi:hypothetical protein